MNLTIKFINTQNTKHKTQNTKHKTQKGATHPFLFSLAAREKLEKNQMGQEMGNPIKIEA